MHIADPVLVGHSIAGEELSAISTYHPGRAAALIYLEATGTFALYNPKHGDYKPALAQLKDDLSELQKNLFDDGLMSKTLTDMALCQANLANLQAEVEGATGPSPKASDLASISAFQSYVKGYYGGIIPESEVRQNFRIGEDGRVGEFLGHGYASQSVMLEEERFHSIDTPLLAILSYPSAPYPSQTSDPAKLAAYRTAGTARIEAQSLRFCFAFFDLGERYGVARTAQRECCWATVTAPSRRRRPTVPVGPFHTRWFGVLLNNVRTPTSTSLASSLNPTVYGQTVEVTATVTSDSGMPTGTVQILNGTTVVGSGTLASGKVSIPVSTLPAGTDSITASYLGGGDFAPSKSSPITQTVTKAPTATSVASSLNPGGTNQALTFTAAVSSQYGGATTGTVTFMAGAQNLGSAALSGNIASLVTSFATAGTYSIMAQYNGDSNNTDSTSGALSEKIIASPTTSVTSSLNPSVAGQTVIFTATVTSSAGIPPNGEIINFYNGTAVLGTAPLSGGRAMLTTSALPAGIFTITARYPGDSTFAASTSLGLRQTVNDTSKSATATTLASSLNPSIYGQKVTLWHT